MVSVSPSNLSINLDRDGEEPIYRQLIRNVKMQIESGSLTAGTRLPASRDLARQLNISRISVVNAYAELRAEGYLSAHAGRGTFVAKEATTSNGHAAAPELNEDTTTPDRSLRDMMRLARRPGVINFSQGAPPSEFFPVHHVRDALNAVLDRDGAQVLAYEEPQGYAPLRVAVRDYVSALGIRCHADQVMITGGAQQALDMVIQAVLTDGDVIVTSNPTYLGLLDIARTRRMQVHGIPTDDDGMRIDLLENYLLENAPSMIYVMPSFQNPTGATMPLHRRRQLLNLAQEHRIPVLEDGVYHEMRFEGETLPPLKALDETGVVLHVSAFTKMMLPGLRIGYIIADSKHFERLVRVKQAADISTPGLNQRAVHWMLERGVLAHQLESNNAELRRRRDVALSAAEKYFPPGTHWRAPQGGMYLWVELPRKGPTASELFITAIQMDVGYAIGNLFYTNNCGSYRIRLNYGIHQPDIIYEGFRRLGRAWRELVCDYADIQKAPIF